MPESKGRIGDMDTKLGRSYDSNLDSQHAPQHENKDVLHGKSL
jgi:hypothetical protein